jgi:hypothetical protein
MEGTKFKNIYEGEYMISELIKGDNGCYTNFDYDSVYQGGTNTTLKVITYNPTHKTHFLLHQIDGIDALDTLHKMYDHIYNIKELLQQKSNTKYASYTVEWWHVDKQGINRSYFYGQNIEEVMRKFYYRKRKEEYTVLSVRLNPET